LGAVNERLAFDDFRQTFNSPSAKRIAAKLLEQGEVVRSTDAVDEKGLPVHHQLELIAILGDFNFGAGVKRESYRQQSKPR